MKHIDLNEGDGPSHSDEPAPEHWPKHVSPISFDGLGRVGVDRDNNLYWDGKRLQTVSKLGLVERLLATAVALGTVSMAAFDAWRFFQGQ